MITTISTRLLSLLAVCAVGLSACSKDEPQSQQSTPSGKYEIVEGTGEQVILEFGGDIDLSGVTRSDDELRSYLLKEKAGEPHTAPIINLDAHKTTPRALLIRLVEKGEPTKITELIVGKDIDQSSFVIEGTEGKYTFKLKTKVKLQEGQSFARGEWYISGIYGGTVDNPLTFEVLPRFVTDSDGAAGVDLKSDPKGGSTTTNGASLVIPWSRVYTRANPSSDNTVTDPDLGVGATAMSQLSPDLGRNFSLRLQPDGVLLRIRPVSRLVNNILYSNIRLKTGDIAFGVHSYAKPASVTEADLTSGARPQVTTTEKSYNDLKFSEQIATKDHTLTGFLLPSGDYGRAELLVWGFPKEGQATSASTTEVYVHSSGRKGHVSRSDGTWTSKSYIVDNGTAHGEVKEFPAQDILYARENWGSGHGGIQDNIVAKRWDAQPVYQTVRKQAYQRGHAYLILPVLDSDLIITERYSQLQNPSEGKRVGLIEIYNPTLRSIDVSQYGIARVAATGMESATVPDVYNPTNGATIVPVFEYGKLYAFPSINASSALMSGFGFWDTDYGFAQGTVYDNWRYNVPSGQNFKDALVMPLSTGLPSRTTGIGLQGTRSVAPDMSATGNNVPKVTYYASDVRSAYVVNYRDFSTDFGGTAYSATGSNLLEPGQTMIVLANWALDNTVTASSIPFYDDIRASVQSGYCKYIVAFNNAQSETATPLEPQAGVMTLGSYDIPVLMKKRTGTQGEYYHLIDGLWSNGNNAYGIAGYLGYASPNGGASTADHGLFNRYVEAKQANATGLWEKRSVGGAIFNYPIGFTAEQVECKPYSPASNNFASFGVLLFDQKTQPRDATKYTIKWKSKAQP